MEPKITTAQQIKDIIEPIPAELFQARYFGYSQDNQDCDNNGREDNGKSCFIGHIHRHFNPSDKYAFGDLNGYGARELTQKYLAEQYKIKANGATVNNFPYTNGYNEPEIKDRVMHLINDMIKDGY